MERILIADKVFDWRSVGQADGRFPEPALAPAVSEAESGVSPFMNIWLHEEFAGLVDGKQLLHVGIRMLAAAGLGAILGYQRGREGKPAGLRTHMLVALGSAVLVLIPPRENSADLSRVIQGIITGIGFLGAGAILKGSEERHIRGLTSAAGIWLAASIGIAVGTGQWLQALLATALGYLILSHVPAFERFARSDEQSAGKPSSQADQSPSTSATPPKPPD